MTELDYQYECSRAELLGLPKPSKEEFFSRQKETKGDLEEENLTAEQPEDAGVKQDQFRRIGGGLDELNSILAHTQKKLNRFKMVCGSFSNLLKLHVGAKKEPDDEKQTEIVDVDDVVLANEKPKDEEGSSFSQNVKDGDSQLSKLDSLISKAERAQLSLSSQNKQMRKFLN